MSQPPGPPGQPPHHHGQGEGDPGVFGAPFEPQPGVYGEPAPDPAYGYGYPPPSGGGRKARRRTAGIVAAVLAGVLVIGAGVWYATGDGGSGDGKAPVAEGSGSAAPEQTGDTPPGRTHTPAPAPAELNAARKDGEDKVLWVQGNTVDLPGRGAPQFGPWFAGDIVAKAMQRTVSGYSAADGTQEWSLDLRYRVCAAPTLPGPDGKIVVALETGPPDAAVCDRLQMIDLRTGEAGWETRFKRAGVWDGLSDVAMAVNGDVVTVGRTSRTEAYRIGDGKLLWDRLPGNCQPYGFASGAVPLAATSCQTSADDHAIQHVRRIDPATGKELWAFPVKKGYKVDQFYSTDPPVISFRQGQEKWAIVILNTDGTYRSQLIADEGVDYETRCGGELRVLNPNLDNCLGVAADASTLYLATKPVVKRKTDPTNAVVAFDLTTGRSRWKAQAPAEQVLLPLRVEGGKVLMYLQAMKGYGRSKGGGIYALPPTGGALRPVLRHPESASGIESTFAGAEVSYSGGRTVLMQPFISGGDDEQEKDIVSMLVFGD
ncbi:PQQ-binding-like beta-propeller repeat protein [Streptomyces sp. SID8374]|uniref:outer membrane protein assembly factor BamB family protein n=1 Tax=Streptomyces sp. SID8374 TaxID=2690354 RepID=UPI00136F72B9|nr:PQQ-binding-like beta-propeller repeat protein [Streptomyces sp. SID8374]MYX14235.1 PQQ-binding-like beta-propeller repeat protein [Streptomyces sp. SID8374]